MNAEKVASVFLTARGESIVKLRFQTEGGRSKAGSGVIRATEADDSGCSPTHASAVSLRQTLRAAMPVPVTASQGEENFRRRTRSVSTHKAAVTNVGHMIRGDSAMLAIFDKRGEVTADCVRGNVRKRWRRTWAVLSRRNRTREEASRQGPVAPPVCTSEVK